MSELKDEKDRLLYSNRQLLDRTFQLEKHVISQDRQIRRQKYKRCLAIAKWCNAEADVADADGDYDDMRWYQKWHYRWLDLAVKFKEAKR